MKILLSPLSFIYTVLMDIRNRLYDKGFLSQVSVESPVMSIGNLSVGGTGKTPFTIMFLKHIYSSRAAVISRNYKAQVKMPSEVSLNRSNELYSSASYFGDEPTLIKSKFTDVRVFVGPNKSQTALQFCRNNKFDVIIVDDGFQHRRLKRDFNVVLLDAVADFLHPQVFPLGRMRESWCGLKRADAIVLTRTQYITESEIQERRNRIARFTRAPIFLVRNRLENVRNMQTNEERLLSSFDEVNLLSAIAQPQGFEQDVRKFVSVKSHFVFSDHHQFSKFDLTRIPKEAPLIVTEKDSVKLKALLLENSDLSVWVADLVTEFVSKEDEEKFYVLARKTLRLSV